MLYLTQGANENEYLIEDEDDLKVLAEKCLTLGTAGITFKLTDDITLTETWTGIGDFSKTKGNAFKGVFDGQNYTIKGLTLAAGKYCGLFGQIDGGTVKNLTIEWAGFADGATGEFGGGALAGYIYGNALIENVTTKNAEGVEKIPSGHNIAGFAVRAETGVTFKNCTNETYIIAGETKAGGFVSITQNATVEDYPATVTFDGCANLGTVEITSGKGGDGAAGFVGCANTSVKFTNGCVSTGTVTDLGTSAKAASLVGYFVVWSPATSNFKVEIAEDTQVADSIKAIHTISPATGTTVADATYATTNGGVATFVKTLVAGKTYKVLVNNSASTDTVELTKDDTVSFDETFFNFAGTVTTTAGAGYEVKPATEGKVKTYSVALKTFNINYVYKTNDVTVVATELTGLVNDNAKTFTVEDVVSITGITLEGFETTSITPEGWAAGEKTADVEVTVLFTKKSGGWDPAADPTTPASDVPGLPDELKVVSLKQISTWATGAGMGKGTDPVDPADVKVEAFLLNCENTDAAIAEAKANFKFTAFDPTEEPTIDGQYNGTVSILKCSDAACTTEWKDGDGQAFYKAVLAPTPVQPK